MKIMRVVLELGVVATLAAGYCGCATVHGVPTDNVPVPGTADLKGMPAETVQHFDEIYPPKNWPPSSKNTIAVGSIVVSREAWLLLSDADSQQASATVTSGESMATVSVENRAGQPRFLSVERCSDEIQSILAESLANNGAFQVIVTGKEGPPLPEGNAEKFMDLRKHGAHYYLTGHLVEIGGESGGVRLYLRIVDLATHKVECATSAEGTDLRDVARRASAQLLSRIGT